MSSREWKLSRMRLGYLEYPTKMPGPTEDISGRLPLNEDPLPSIPLFRPTVGHLERDYVLRALDSSWLSDGNFVKKLETHFRHLTHHSCSLAVSSGTAALDIACRLSGFGPGDRIFTTPLTYIASTSCLLNVGATPVFADVDPDTLNLDV